MDNGIASAIAVCQGANNMAYRDVIITALEEKAERDKGCECCNGYRGALWTYRDIDNSHRRSILCPNCGRKLREEDKP